MSLPFVIPQYDGEPMTWNYFVLQAARGSVRVADWVHLSVPCFVSERLEMPAHAVDAEHIEQMVAGLPLDPRPMLYRMVRPAELTLPEVDANPMLKPDEGIGSFREPVPFPELLHDATLVVQREYGRDGFFRCLEAVDAERLDSRVAVASMMYLLLTRSV